MSIVDPSVLELLNHAESRYTLVVEASILLHTMHIIYLNTADMIRVQQVRRRYIWNIPKT